VHWQKDAMTPGGVVDLAKISPILYLGNNLYLTPAKDTISYIDREV